jgi:hypothetical protein
MHKRQDLQEAEQNSSMVLGQSDTAKLRLAKNKREKGYLKKA